MYLLTNLVNNPFVGQIFRIECPILGA